MVLVRNHGNFVKHINDVMVLPGTNEISDKDVEKMKAHPLFEAIEESGEVEVVEDSKDTTKLNVKDAKKLIKDTFIVAILDDWKEKENRTTVKKAIDEQIENLTTETKSSEEDNFVN